jgi:hypothetical protein
MARKAKRSRRNFSGYQEDQTQPKGPTVSEKPLSPDPTGFARFLPRSLDDESIKTSAFALLDKLDIHVDNFYRNSSTPVSAEALAILAPVASKQLLKRAPTVGQKRRPKPILTYLLAELVTSYISPSGDPAKTFLPVDFPMFSTVRKNACKSAVNIDRRSRVAHPVSDSEEAMYKSRMLAAYLHPHASEEAGYVAQRQQAIWTLTSAVSRAFSEWELGKYGEDERVRSLTKIFGDAAELGILLYSQPSGFEFHWSRSLDEKLPSLRKVSDEKGGILPKPQTLVEGVKMDS